MLIDKKKPMHLKNIIYVIFILFSLVFSNLDSTAQCTTLDINDNIADSTLVKDFLLGDGVKVSNIKYTGSLKAIGSFSGNALPFKSGIVMSTGKVKEISAPNSGSVIGIIPLNTNGSSILDSIITNSFDKTLDASTLEFDFIPTSDTVRFNYIFASEEYPTYVGSGFNDVFGFFISGPGFTGKENIAIIPNTNSYVSINTVNDTANSDYYINNNDISSDTYNCFPFNGYTTVLQAIARVVPCQKYHIVLVIADVSDPTYDSGVFLEAGSFKSESVKIKNSPMKASINDTALIEGCLDVLISFVLDKPVTKNTTVPFYLGGTATMGVDYNNIPTSVTFKAGEDSASIVLSAIKDNLVEGTETIIFNVQKSICSQDVETKTIYILDYITPSVNITENTNICQGGSKELKVISTSDGIAPYTFYWNTSESTSSIIVSPNMQTEYLITATDKCGNTATDKVTVGISLANASLGPDIYICPNTETTISVSGEGEYSWNTGHKTQSITISPSTTTKYFVTVDDGCVVTDEIMVYTHPINQVSITANKTNICIGDTSKLTASGSIYYAWTSLPFDVSIEGQENKNIIHVAPESTTTYLIVASDSNFCQTYSSIVIGVNEGASPYFEFSSSGGCVENDIKVHYKGNGTPNGQYHWNFYDAFIKQGTGVGPYNLKWNTSGYKKVSLSVTDFGCTSSTYYDSIYIFDIPLADFSYDITNGCIPLQVTFTDYSLFLNENSSYFWDFGDGTISTEQNPVHNFKKSGNFLVSLRVNTGFCSNTKTEQYPIQVYPNPNASFSVSPDNVTILDPVVDVVNMSYGADSIKWVLWNDSVIFNKNKLNLVFHDSGIYSINLWAFNNYGCRDSIENVIMVKTDVTLYIPKSFTPNEDDINDVFKIYGKGISKFEIIIYNRWGEVIHTSDDINNAWDGKTKNKEIAKPGIYPYIIKVTNDKSRESKIAGYIVLLN